VASKLSSCPEGPSPSRTGPPPVSSNLFISENASTKPACLLALAKFRAYGQRRYLQMVQEPASIAIPFGASAFPASLVPNRPCTWPHVLCLWPCLERGASSPYSTPIDRLLNRVLAPICLRGPACLANATSICQHMSRILWYAHVETS
jgi:hypothetical protein